MLLTRPELNLFAGWRYVISPRFRKQTQVEWRNLPAWVVAMQMVAGTCSVLFPGIIFALLAYVFIVQNFL